MKKFNLVLSLVLTLIVLSISFVSGENSGSTGLEISTFILRIITGLFPNNSIVLAELHTVLQIVGHVLLYIILGITWFFTGKLWRLSLMRVLIIGLMIASIDELIGLIGYNQDPNFLKTLAIDFLPFLMISLFLFRFANKEQIGHMRPILNKVKSGDITADQAYTMIYENTVSKMPVTWHAHLIRLRIVVPDEKAANIFLGIIFFFPIPIGFVRFILTFIKEEQLHDSPFTKSEIIDMISSKGINVKVNANDKTKVIIRTI